MLMEGYGLSDVGQERSNNEDSLLIDDALGLYVVADGMGGHAAGEVASSTAVRTVSRFLHDKGLADDLDRPVDEILALAEQAVQSACRRVWELATSRPGCAGMGTTLTLLMIRGTTGLMVHVGDSRLYLKRDDRLDQLSDDHTFTGELVRNGVFTAEQVQNSPYSNVLTRALGKSEKVQTDSLIIDILPGDTFLLCSDGLTNHVKDSELDGILRADELRPLPKHLIRLANNRGGDDNITAIVVRAGNPPPDTLVFEHCTRVQEQFNTIRSVSLFMGISMAGLVKIMDISREVEFKIGDRPISEGDPCPGLIIILSGSMGVWRGGYKVTSLRAGAMAGEMSCLRRKASTATLQAEQNTRCLFIEFDALDGLFRKDSALGVRLLQNLGETLAERLDQTTGRLLELKTQRDDDDTPPILFVP